MSRGRARFGLAVAFALPLCGCFAIPVQEMVLRNEGGGTITCKQTGKGLISSSTGKASFDECVANAKAAGYK
jgi:hypothetical protein